MVVDPKEHELLARLKVELANVEASYGPVQALFECQIGHPAGALTQLPLLPIIVITRLKTHIRMKELSGKSLQQHTGNQSVQITLVSQNDFRPG